jgi:hypothetical protein
MKKIGGTYLGWIFLYRHNVYDHFYRISRWKAKRIIKQAFQLFNDYPYYHKLITLSDRVESYRVHVHTGSNPFIGIGCNTFTRSDLEAICKHYGWRIA